jgi:DNA adenine methylase Dam
MNYIDKRIKEFNLNKTNEEGYLAYRKLYNIEGSEYSTPLDLFTLTRFSYNQIIRFNNKMEFNAAFGKNRSSYNDNMRNNTIAFQPRIQDIQFLSTDFRTFSLDEYTKDDFIYVDPPYLIANADYNAGRTAKLSWNATDEKTIQTFLDDATAHGLKWGMSNFIKHKDKVNTITEEWAHEHNYNVYNIKADYSKLTTKAERVAEPTLEVLITNYD